MKLIRSYLDWPGQTPSGKGSLSWLIGQLGSAAGSQGSGILAYTLGMRNAFDAVFIGAIGVLDLLGQDGNLTGSGWAWLENFNINTAGFVIVGVFILTWAAALSIWHFGKIEQKWDLAASEANVIK